MEDYQSKYTGEQVESLLDKVANGEVGGGIEEETDPIFSASPAASITEEKIAEWDAKSEQGEKGDKGDKGDTGVGVQSVVQTTTSNADDGSNVVTVTLTDGTTSTFTVKNGSKGSQGEKGEQGPKGDTGATGPAGANGTNGVSVSSVKQTTTSTADGGTNVVTVTLSNGTTSTFNVKNGSKGSNGTNGTNGKDGADGEDGATFTPSVDSEGNLSWTNDKGLTNPPTVNIKGPKGDAGSGGDGSSSSSAKEFVVKEPDSDPSGNIGGFLQDDPLQPNKVYVFSQPIYSLYIAYINESMGAGDEYTIMFTSEGATSILIGADYQVYWANGTIPTISNGDMCELSLVRIGSVLKAVLSIFKAE